MATLLVTGAGGTVGGYVVSLAEAAGHRVIVSDVPTARPPVPVRGEVRLCDLRDTAAIKALVRGVDVVVHSAAELNPGVTDDERRRVNVTAVEALYEAAEAAGARRFVHMSTAMVYRAGQPGPLRVGAELGARGALGESKLAAEEWLRARRGGLPWTILRAAPIYGRRGRHFAASLLSLGPILRLGSPILPRPRGGPVGTMAHAEDVARALLFVMDRPAAAHAVFDVSDGHALSLGDRLAITFDAYGLRTVGVGDTGGLLLARFGRMLDAPGAYRAADVTALSAWGVVIARHRLKPALRPRLDREALSLLYDDLVVDATRLRDLGWAPIHDDFARSFLSVLRWYQAERWVPRYGAN